MNFTTTLVNAVFRCPGSSIPSRYYLPLWVVCGNFWTQTTKSDFLVIVYMRTSPNLLYHLNVDASVTAWGGYPTCIFVKVWSGLLHSFNFEIGKCFSKRVKYSNLDHPSPPSIGSTPPAHVRKATHLFNLKVNHCFLYVCDK